MLAVSFVGFEDAPADNALVLPAYANDRGFRFIANQGSLYFEKVGGEGLANPVNGSAPGINDNPQGFVRDFPAGPNNATSTLRRWDLERAADQPYPTGYDRAANGPGLGEFFMRSSSTPGNPFAFDKSQPIFSIQFLKQPVGIIGGQIWDIDGTGSNSSERWRINIIGSGNSLLGQLQSPLGTSNGQQSLDGLPWLFQIDTTAYSSPIKRLEFQFAGTKNEGIGVAFDNFSAAVVPEARTWAMLIAGFGLVGAAMRRRRAAIA